jgi:hypothetical protein
LVREHGQVSRFGECVVRTSPAGVHRYLLAQPSTREEGQALLTLRLALGSCLTAGHTLKIDRRVLRGSLATNYYRLAKAPRTPNYPQN